MPPQPALWLISCHMPHPRLPQYRPYLHALDFELTWLPTENLGWVLLHSLLYLSIGYFLCFGEIMSYCSFQKITVSKEKRTLGNTA